jgi:hypothetical protein
VHCFTSTGRRKLLKVPLVLDIVFTVVKCKYLGTWGVKFVVLNSRMKEMHYSVQMLTCHLFLKHKKQKLYIRMAIAYVCETLSSALRKAHTPGI